MISFSSSSRQIQRTTKLTHLNFDILFNICKELGTLDVISMLKTNEYFSNVAVVFLSHKFSKKLLIFDVSNRKRYDDDDDYTEDNFSDDEYLKKISNGYKIIEDEKTIRFERAGNIIKDILELGVEFKKLEIIDYGIYPLDDEAEHIFKLINQYCFKILIELKVKRIKSFFNFIEKPFENVETFSWANYGSGEVFEANLDELRQYFNFF